MATCLAALFCFIYWARQAIPGLPSVWWGLAVFFACRAGQTVPRALQQLSLLGGGHAAAAAAGQQQKQPLPAA